GDSQRDGELSLPQMAAMKPREKQTPNRQIPKRHGRRQGVGSDQTTHGQRSRRNRWIPPPRKVRPQRSVHPPERQRPEAEGCGLRKVSPQINGHDMVRREEKKKPRRNRRPAPGERPKQTENPKPADGGEKRDLQLPSRRQGKTQEVENRSDVEGKG